MRLRDDRRAAALQVGAVLLLGFLVIGLALYQSTVVPDQNERVEFEHNQQVQESLQEVRNGILRTAAAERTSPTAVPLGTRYPTRIVAVNPPPSSGRLATEPGGQVTLVNATAINDETADFWNGTNRSYATKQLSYQPDYSLYQAAPRTVYDDTVAYNQFDGRRLPMTEQALLDGNRIYVVALNGSYSRSGTRSVSVNPSPVSTSDRTVAINDSAGLALEVDTELSESEWENLLDSQYERNGGRIAGNADGVTVNGGTLTVDLLPGTYRLRMAKVGVGTGITDTSEQYLTVVDGADSVTAGGTRRIVLEVRDGYNNPVPGVTVNASVNRSDASIRPSRGVSDGDGRVVFEYATPDSLPDARTDSINFTFRGAADRPDFSGEEPESVRLNVTVVSLGGGTSEQLIEKVDGSGRAVDAAGGNEDESVESVRFVLRNTGSSDVALTDIAVDSTSAGADRVQGSPTVSSNRTGRVDNNIVVGGESEPFDPDGSLPANSDTAFTIGRFKDRGDLDMSGADITVTLTFADGTTRTYTITAA